MRLGGEKVLSINRETGSCSVDSAQSSGESQGWDGGRDESGLGELVKSEVGPRGSSCRLSHASQSLWLYRREQSRGDEDGGRETKWKMISLVQKSSLQGNR